MNNGTLIVARAVTLGAVGAVLSGSLAGPARAARAVQPITTRPVTTTPIQPVATDPAIAKPVTGLNPVILFKFADLRLESFDITPMGGNNWKLKATLRNGSPNPTDNRQTYPGGGWLIIGRTSGGTIVSAPPAEPFAAVPDNGQQLKKVAIPALANGQAITVEVTTHGRAIFSAAAVPDPPVIDGPTFTLPEIDKTNNSKTVNKLIPLNLSINSALLQTFLGPVIDDFQIHLHKTDSYIKLPGFYNATFNIPQAKMGLPWPLGDAYWYVNNINLSSASIGIADKSLALTLQFETGGDEIVGWVDGGPDWLAPNVNASPLNVSVKLPLTYNSAAQFFYYNNPQVSVNASWSLNGPLPDSLLPDINGQIANGIKSMLNDNMVQAQIEYELNKQIRLQLLKGGRILSASVQPTQVNLSCEVGG
jgi:hypothetical protein